MRPESKALSLSLYTHTHAQKKKTGRKMRPGNKALSQLYLERDLACWWVKPMRLPESLIHQVHLDHLNDINLELHSRDLCHYSNLCLPRHPHTAFHS